MDYNDEIHSDDWHAREVSDSPIAIKVITAQEACQRTQENINKNVSAELTKIMQKIHEEIKAGKFQLSESGHLNQITKDKLTELGYKVETGSQYNEPYYCIKWDNV